MWHVPLPLKLCYHDGQRAIAVLRDKDAGQRCFCTRQAGKDATRIRTVGPDAPEGLAADGDETSALSAALRDLSLPPPAGIHSPAPPAAPTPRQQKHPRQAAEAPTPRKRSTH